MHQNGNGCHLWVVHLRMALFFIISYFYKFSATGKCRSHNEERKTREHVKDVSGSDGLWGASGGVLRLLPAPLLPLPSLRVRRSGRSLGRALQTQLGAIPAPAEQTCRTGDRAARRPQDQLCSSGPGRGLLAGRLVLTARNRFPESRGVIGVPDNNKNPDRKPPLERGMMPFVCSDVSRGR